MLGLLKGFILASLWTIIAYITSFLATTNYTTDLATRPNAFPVNAQLTYDFIIVGAGSAGSVVASRLAANKAFKVLLLEAGGDPLLTENIPYLSGYILYHPMTDWMYKTVPQPNSCKSFENNEIPWSRGKSLGGCSNLNHMIYMRGNPNDFDNWADLTHDPKWNYENSLPYFKKSEDYNGNFPNPEYHGTGGPLAINAQNYQPMIKEWVQAGQELFGASTDPNGRQTAGFTAGDFTIKNGKRWGVFDAFLKPAMRQSNLHVVRYAHVTKIELDSSNKATGVMYQRHGQTICVKANKEIIISGGSIGSPHLLMLSGIGPAEHLRSIGIEPKVDLPGVGQNLQDHVSSIVGPFILNDTVSFISDRNLTETAIYEYLLMGTGPISFNYVSGMGLYSTPDNKDPTWPNVALTHIPFGIHNSLPSDIAAMFGVKESDIRNYLKDFVGKDANFVLMYAGLPASMGTVTLQSSNPYDHPLIDPKYYSDPKDMKVMIDAFKFVVKVYEETNTWQKYNATLPAKHYPGCEEHTLRSDAYYECYLRHFTGTMWHPTSTCKMGAANDPMAVVDTDLRVRNVQGLRIIDASVFPKITNTNTNAPTIMIGERAADLIIKAWTT